MHKGARTDLCGGRGVTRVPTATSDRAVMGPHAQKRHAQQMLCNLRPVRRCDAWFPTRNSSPKLKGPKDAAKESDQGAERETD
jgi:hypothetical protein